MDTAIFEQMTKQEIIRWIKQEIIPSSIRMPRKSDILWYRYEKKQKELLDRSRANTQYGKSLDMLKRNEYAKKFNNTNDIKERLSLLGKMEPFEKKRKKYTNEIMAIMDEEKKCESLYSQIEKERQKETKGE